MAFTCLKNMKESLNIFIARIVQNICAFVETEMGQRIGKWHLAPVLRGFTFCGFRIRTKFKLIKRQSIFDSDGSYR